MKASYSELHRTASENGPISKIGTFRLELMGMAGLLLMLYHSSFRIPNVTASYCYTHIRWLFAIGVDLFFLLSGYGLYHSMRRDPDVRRFYKKRLLRLLPTYLLFVTGWFAISLGRGIETPASFLQKHAVITFFTHGEVDVWFIAAILLVYTTYSNYSVAAAFLMNIAAYVLAVFAAWHLNKLSGFLTRRISKAS